MNVTLVGYTVATNLDAFDAGWNAGNGEWSGGAQYLMEGAGRLCYQSWKRPNPDTATNEGYLGNILDHKHFSVLEHGVATFLITGVSRTLTHEIIRHRHLSPSELSQRFVNMDSCAAVIPPLYRRADAHFPVAQAHLEGEFENAKRVYGKLVSAFEGSIGPDGEKVTRKQAREAARAVLPGMTETKIVLTGNVRAWRGVIEQRATVHADKEIRALAVEIFKQLKGLWPNCFQDMAVAVDADGYEIVGFIEKENS